MRRYEIMYILNANLDEEARKALMEKLHSVITENGSKIVEVNEELPAFTTSPVKFHLATAVEIVD